MGGNLSFNDNDDVQLKGATDGTLIGNVSDSLKVAIVGFATEAEYPTFCACAESVQIGNNKSMISIVNTSGSTVKVKIREIKIINVQTTAVTGVVADFRLLRCVTHSVGTALTPASYDTTDSLSVSITARTGATIGTEGTAVLRRWQWSSDEWGPGAADVEASDHALQALIPGYYTINKTKPITLNANEGVTLKQVTNSTVGTFDIMVVFTQE